MKINRFKCLWIIACLCSTPAIAVEINYDQFGSWQSVIGLEVDGSLYDIRFVSGGCTDAYGVCDNSHFGLAGSTNGQFAYDASIALSSLILHSQLPVSMAGSPYGQVLTAFNQYFVGPMPFPAQLIQTYSIATSWFDSSGEGGDIRWINGPDFGSVQSKYFLYDTSAAWAVWTPSTTPLPGTAYLFGTGLLGLMGMYRIKSFKINR